MTGDGAAHAHSGVILENSGMDVDCGEESENVLDELIELYESERGEPPTDDAVRRWMMTLQEATSTSALAEGVGEEESGGGGGRGGGGAALPKAD